MSRRSGNGAAQLVAALIVSAAVFVAWQKLRTRRCPDCDLEFKALELLSMLECPGCGRVVGALEALSA